MRKKHPIRNFFVLLLIAAIVAGLAALPLLTAGSGDEENKVSILTGVPERRTLSRKLYSGGTLTSQTAETVDIPSGIQVIQLLVNTGDTVKAGDPVARVDDLSVRNAIRSVQESLDTLAKQLQTARAKITPGVITVNEDGKLCAGGSVIADDKLTYYTQFAQLSDQHREYEALLAELFRLHQDDLLKAPCDGIVGDLDKSMVKPLSASEGGRLVPLALNTPDGNDFVLYTCYAQKIVGFAENGNWIVRWGRYASYVQNFLDTGSLDLTLTDEQVEQEPEYVFAYRDGEWGTYSPRVGDILMYAIENTPERNYWVIWAGNMEDDEPQEQPPEENDPSEEPENPGDTEEPGEEPGEDGEEGTQPEGGSGSGTGTGTGTGGNGGGRPGGGMGEFDIGSIIGSMGGFSGGSRGGAGSSGQTASLYSLEKTTLCTVTPAETMTLSLSIDEADITALEIGMEAELTLEAMPNRRFTAVITDISKFGVTGTGSTKFDVTMEIACTDGMLPGMNANITLELERRENCITVPVAALADQGTKTVIYTARDEKTGELTAPVPVTLGLSDGEWVQVLSGLPENTSFVYSYYDTLEISTAVETRGMFG